MGVRLWHGAFYFRTPTAKQILFRVIGGFIELTNKFIA